MTKVPRRTTAAPMAKVHVGPVLDNGWSPPFSDELEPRVTSAGRVSCLPSPIQACWAEAVGRARDPKSYVGELEGLCVALSILTCLTLEDVRAEVDRRAQVPVSRSGRRS